MIMTCRHILLISGTRHVRLYDHDGNQQGAWQLPSSCPISSDSVSLSNDTVAFLDAAQPNSTVHS